MRFHGFGGALLSAFYSGLENGTLCVFCSTPLADKFVSCPRCGADAFSRRHAFDWSATTEVRIFHNITPDPDREGRPVKGMLDGYEEGDLLSLVFSYRDVVVPNKALDQAWLIGNLDPQDIADPNLAGVARAYRGREVRSLSVGDVVQVNDTYFACESFGWRELQGIVR